MADSPALAADNDKKRANALASDRAKERNKPTENLNKSLPAEDAPLIDEGGGQPPQIGDQAKNAGGDMEADRQNEIAKRNAQNGPNTNKTLEGQGIDTKNFISDLGKKFLGVGKKANTEQTKAAWADELKKRISEGKIKVFGFLLALALVKDAPDIAAILGGDPGVIGDIINLFVTPILVALLSCQGSWLKQKLFNKFFGWLATAIIAEMIPGVSVFPTYTVAVLALFFNTNTDIKKLGAALNMLGKPNTK